ncbi:MAG: N-acetyl sugar amidotransferase [Polyangiaceae bacterium]|nr:N-acetyl sugar amidotransferase [Polyangiaceae bacterium]
MRYCTRCIQPDTRPGTRFDAEGVCPACRYAESLAEVDWSERDRVLAEIVEFGRQNSHSGYDCIIGVSGGKDSTRQALFVRETLGMRPLLVCLGYPPEQVTQRGVDNLSNLVRLGFDCVQINPGPRTWKALMKRSFFLHANWCKSTELALFSAVPRLAIAYQIPLIWWGENAALQLGDLNVLGKEGWDGNNLRNMNTLAGGDLTWLLADGVRRNQLLQYCYPSVEQMDAARLKIVFLGYFWRDWSLVDNGVFAALRGLDVRREPPWDIGDPVGVTSLDEDWVTFNQRIKYLKFGFGRVTDYVNEDIRLGRLTREAGARLAERYDGRVAPRYVASFCRYLGIEEAEFHRVVDACVNRELFAPGDGAERWVRRFEVG